MAADEVETTVNATPDAVWAVVGDFGGIDAFFPGIETFRVEGDDRVIGMFGIEIREHLVARDEAARSITYSVTDGVPMDHHEATITVTEGADAGTSKVVWAFAVTPDEMLPIFTDTYTAAVAAVKANFEG